VLGRRRRDLYYTFDFLLAESERRRLPSTYYFMAGVTDPRFDGPYYLNEGWAKELIHTVASKGHRVGLHPSYETFLDPAAIRAEVGRLQAVCSEIPEPKIAIRDSRQHFLRWRYPDTWRHLEAAGIATDASLGFPDHVGFRAGTCRSFATFDSVERRPLALRAIPLIAMDVTLTSYMKLERAEILATVEKLASKCRQAGGKFSLLWHNSSLLTPSAKKLYTDTLDRLASLA
jgi:hypothetical protein